MKNISLTQLKKMTGDEIKESGCFNLTRDGESLAIVVVGAVEETRTKIVVTAGMIDAMRGK